jgi:hypothetical protein
MTSVARKHSSTRGAFIVSNTLINTTSNPTSSTRFSKQSLLNKKTAIAGAVAVALIGGGAAFGYPPGMDLNVSATATPQGGQTQVMVSIQNSNPSCSTVIQVEGAASDTTFGPGQTTGTVTIPAGSGSRRVEARTTGCSSGSNEHAHSNFSIVDAQASGAANSPVNKNYVVSFTGLDQNSSVTSTATLQGSNPLRQVVSSDNANKRGTASTKFKLKYAGTWVVSTTISPSGTVNTVTVNVS